MHWFGGGLPALFAAIAIALVTFGLTVAAAIKAGAWEATESLAQGATPSVVER